MPAENEERHDDRKEHKSKHKHRERDRDHRDKDRDRERGRDRETGKDADKHVLERGSSHRSDKDRDRKRDRRDRHRDQGEDTLDKRSEQHDDPGRSIPEPAADDRTAPSDEQAAGMLPSAPAEAAPDISAIKPQVQESGGEVSMSVEETNRSSVVTDIQTVLRLHAVPRMVVLKLFAMCRVRISLGLKPLSTENSADTKRKEFEARQKVQAERERDAQAAALADRVQK